MSSYFNARKYYLCVNLCTYIEINIDINQLGVIKEDTVLEYETRSIVIL